MGEDLIHISPGSTPIAWLVVLGAAVLSAFGCRTMSDFARKRHLLDTPNERSLHQVPVPRLGGVAIVVASWLPVAILWMLSRAHDRVLLAWLIASLLVAGLG